VSSRLFSSAIAGEKQKYYATFIPMSTILFYGAIAEEHRKAFTTASFREQRPFSDA
jgi:hypothetical protein